jgi:hypothetical protein
MVWSGPMYRFLGLLVSLALTAPGCAKKAEPKPPIPQAAFLRVDYKSWTCPQLVEEADLLSDALAVAMEDQTGAQMTEQVRLIDRSEEAVRKELAAKECKV